VFLADLTRAVNALPQNMTSQMFSAIAAVTGQGQNPNATPAQWASSQYGYGGSGGGSSAYHVGVTSVAERRCCVASPHCWKPPHGGSSGSLGGYSLPGIIQS